ncbi:hypothetical protein [Lactococcus termiticola]|uniref:Uncharacterized protein n=1 Tax=Lactococcus termiticola TaxID=2169526 RepID=A0A2R5HGB7_9LACT|nr:hypothetical protein [Lactococcus termiticola]GBG97107.1 hypothetical protein NtB2_01244 [Lactococcus termiticola]
MNEKKHMFKRKVIGWGLTPVTLSGWLFVLAWIVIFVGPALIVAGLHGQLHYDYIPSFLVLPFIWMALGLIGLIVFVVKYLNMLTREGE